MVNHAILSSVHQEHGAHRGFEPEHLDADTGKQSSSSAWIRRLTWWPKGRGREREGEGEVAFPGLFHVLGKVWQM